MNTRNDSGFKPMLVGTGGVVRNTLVTLSSGTVVTAGAGEDSIGVALDTVDAAGYVSVKLWSAPGTVCINAAAAVASGAAVYAAASGYVDDVVAGDKIGTALEAAAAAGDDIEILPATPASLTAVQSHIADPAACAAMTAADPADQAAITGASMVAPTQGTYTSSTSLTDPPTKAEAEAELGLIDAELDKVKVDIAAAQTAIDANVVDIAAARTAMLAQDAEAAKVVTDLAAISTNLGILNSTVDSILAALEANGILATS